MLLPALAKPGTGQAHSLHQQPKTGGLGLAIYDEQQNKLPPPITLWRDSGNRASARPWLRLVIIWGVAKAINLAIRVSFGVPVIHLICQQTPFLEPMIITSYWYRYVVWDNTAAFPG